MADGSGVSPCGVLLVDKPAGPSSFAMVRQVRRLLGVRKVGHAGTLDPLASGLLVICVGRGATRLSARFMEGRKRYEAILALGVETDSFDGEGQVTATAPVPDIGDDELARLADRFRGEILQTPPPFSALKHKGKPLYHYARKGEVVVKEARPVQVHELSLTRLDRARLALTVECGKGTYIRSLAADIGRELGCGAHLAALRRTACGGFSVADAVDGAGLAGSGFEKLLDRLIKIEDIEELTARHDSPSPGILAADPTERQDTTYGEIEEVYRGITG
ncbi:MAG: tRNA pseudouridine(55) synthase TruB [Thermodesulfobacteriota bacterium]